MNQHKAKSADRLPSKLRALLKKARETNQSVVLVTGVFDLLHQEHRNFLRKAQAAGDILLVGVESDKRVRQIKGQSRPLNNELIRRDNLQKLKIANYVFILPDQFAEPKQHRDLIKTIRPAVLAVSSHTNHLDKKQTIVKEFGGEVKIVHQYNPEVSTTKLLKQQNDLKKNK